MTRFAMIGGMALTLALSASAEDKKDVPKELAPFQGLWKVAEASRDGQPAPKESVETLRFKFSGTELTVYEKEEPRLGSYSVDAKKDPAEITLVSDKGNKTPGIYKFGKDGKMTFAFQKGPDAKRPKGFDDKDATIMVLEKVK